MAFHLKVIFIFIFGIRLIWQDPVVSPQPMPFVLVHLAEIYFLSGMQELLFILLLALSISRA